MVLSCRYWLACADVGVKSILHYITCKIHCCRKHVMKRCCESSSPCLQFPVAFLWSSVSSTENGDGRYRMPSTKKMTNNGALRCLLYSSIGMVFQGREVCVLVLSSTFVLPSILLCQLHDCLVYCHQVPSPHKQA